MDENDQTVRQPNEAKNQTNGKRIQNLRTVMDKTVTSFTKQIRYVHPFGNQCANSRATRFVPLAFRTT